MLAPNPEHIAALIDELTEAVTHYLERERDLPKEQRSSEHYPHMALVARVKREQKR